MVNSISGLGNAAQEQAINNARNKVQAVIESIVSGLSSQDVATVSVASQLQSETSGLKQVSGNLAQASSLTQVADGGAEQIQNVLGQLRTIAQQAASPTNNADTRAHLNEQFQQLTNQVDNLANSTSFNGQNLLNGSLTGGSALSLDSLLSSGSGGTGNELSIGSLTSNGLFGGKSLNILSADNAGQALSAINNAINEVTGARASIGAFQQTLNFAGANVDSAIINQEAAHATLSETDLGIASTNLSAANLQQNAAIALAAQGNKLSPTLLQLIG